MIKGLILLVAVLALLAASEEIEKQSNVRAQIPVEFYYTANSDRDGDYIVSQLVPEIPISDLSVLTFAYGGVQVLNIPDSVTLENKYYCSGPPGLCETNLIHWCVQRNQADIQVNFLACYFQSELYPAQPMDASFECVRKLAGNTVLQQIIGCTQANATMQEYGFTYFAIDALKPSVVKTPYLLLSPDAAHQDLNLEMASIDLKKALCQAKSLAAGGDTWQCESVDRYKIEPVVEIYYSPYQTVSTDFFQKQLTQALAQNVFDTTQRVDILPNPNPLVNCQGVNCWTYQAHWCLFELTAGTTQLEIIKCAFGKSSSISDQDRIKQCTTDAQYQEITNCISDIADYQQPIKLSAQRLNRLIPLQLSVEILIKDRPNGKAKSGLLQELCSNYMDIDDETLGCKVNRPKVQIFYETESRTVLPKFDDVVEFGQYAPFNQIAEIEFIPYGNTVYHSENNSYTCTEGDNQCHANWIHACILKNRFTTVKEKFLFYQFFSCATAYNAGKNPNDQAEECVNQIYDDGPNFWVTTLMLCSHTDTELFAEMRTKTEAIKIAQIPEIAVNGEKKTTELGTKMLANLCQSYISPIKPKLCSTIDRETSQTLQVKVYLTADDTSRNFVQNQLKPLLDSPQDPSLQLRDVIEWKFVPWGAASYNTTTGEISCPGGENECLANRILSCATRQRQNGKLGAREDKQRVLKFAVCYFDSTSWKSDPLKAASECVGELSPLDSYPDLWQCAVQDLKLELFIEMRNDTLNNYPEIANFPMISIDQRLQNVAASTALNRYLCQNYKATLSPISQCRNTGGSGAFSPRVSLLLFTLLTALAGSFSLFVVY